MHDIAPSPRRWHVRIALIVTSHFLQDHRSGGAGLARKEDMRRRHGRQCSQANQVYTKAYTYDLHGPSIRGRAGAGGPQSPWSSLSPRTIQSTHGMWTLAYARNMPRNETCWLFCTLINGYPAVRNSADHPKSQHLDPRQHHQASC